VSISTTGVAFLYNTDDGTLLAPLGKAHVVDQYADVSLSQSMLADVPSEGHALVEGNFHGRNLHGVTV